MSIERLPHAPDNFGYPKSVASIQAFLRRHQNSYADLTRHLNQEEIEGWIRSTYYDASRLTWFGDLDVARVAFGKGASYERVFCYATNPVWRAVRSSLTTRPIFICEVTYRWNVRRSLRQFSLHGLSEYLLQGGPGYKLGTRAMKAKLADDSHVRPAGVAK